MPEIKFDISNNQKKALSNLAANYNMSMQKIINEQLTYYFKRMLNREYKDLIAKTDLKIGDMTDKQEIDFIADAAVLADKIKNR